ncbi:MAG TPA: glycerol kinase GlpK [Woeseiaceae bacterium]|nr:glycerol kinase GlpK [Woeseiaceae bacterium]
MAEYILAIDQGTSSSRAVLFDRQLVAAFSAQQEFPQIYPQPGWVEHDPAAIWQSVLQVTREVLQKGGQGAGNIAGIGISNQRETTLVWDRQSGRCIHNAIVWQDRRTTARCAELQRQGLESTIEAKTGLRLDPYFSATKIAWILDNVPGARHMAETGELAFGTVDTFLLWRLTGGKVHATDATNASRTLLFNIHNQEWDDALLRLFAIPRSLLPEVKDCAADFGTTEPSLFGAAIPVSGMAGDQQAALIGQSGFEAGTCKSTYGTGCFVIANTGTRAIRSGNKMLATIAYRFGGKVTYGLEGSIFVAGSAIQWLRDQLGIVKSAQDTEAIAEKTGIVSHVHVVPAFAGLGAPYWDPAARGAILGLSRDSGIGEIVTATLQAIAYQTRDLLLAMREDGIKVQIIRVDGGMVGNRWFLQFLADILGVTVERPVNIESTALGAACVAALQCGMIASPAAIGELWQRDSVYEPRMDSGQREQLYAGWLDAVSRVRSKR